MGAHSSPINFRGALFRGIIFSTNVLPGIKRTWNAYGNDETGPTRGSNFSFRSILRDSSENFSISKLSFQECYNFLPRASLNIYFSLSIPPLNETRCAFVRLLYVLHEIPSIVRICCEARNPFFPPPSPFRNFAFWNAANSVLSLTLTLFRWALSLSGNNILGLQPVSAVRRRAGL